MGETVWTASPESFTVNHGEPSGFPSRGAASSEARVDVLPASGAGSTGSLPQLRRRKSGAQLHGGAGHLAWSAGWHCGRRSGVAAGRAWKQRLFGEVGPGPIRSVAVLPLQNLSNDPNQEYFVDGMTDELITDLAQIRELKVVSKTSIMQYKGTRTRFRRLGGSWEWMRWWKARCCVRATG
jgi:hypothetical protein